MALKEMLTDGGRGIRFFHNCSEIIRTLPALTVDKIRPTDCATRPHELTHAPDALRGYAIFYAQPAPIRDRVKAPWTADMWEDYQAAGEAEKKYLIKKYGEPN